MLEHTAGSTGVLKATATTPKVVKLHESKCNAVKSRVLDWHSVAVHSMPLLIVCRRMLRIPLNR